MEQLDREVWVMQKGNKIHLPFRGECVEWIVGVNVFIVRNGVNGTNTRMFLDANGPVGYTNLALGRFHRAEDCRVQKK